MPPNAAKRRQTDWKRAVLEAGWKRLRAPLRPRKQPSPVVLECAVIGTLDEHGLTRTKAFVVLRPGHQASEDELKAHVKRHLAPYKYPRVIEFIAELPKTATGKIQRFRLREREGGR